jgi:hypothetical protein
MRGKIDLVCRQSIYIHISIDTHTHTHTHTLMVWTALRKSISSPQYLVREAGQLSEFFLVPLNSFAPLNSFLSLLSETRLVLAYLPYHTVFAE